jgi:zinc protease
MGSKTRCVARLLWIGLSWGVAVLSAADLPPTVPPPKPFQSAMPVVRVLPNGLKLAVIERHELPIIGVRLVVQSGAEADPASLPGTAQMVASLLNQGTTKRSAQEIARTIDQIGGTVETGADWDNSFVAVSVLTDRTELAFEMVSDMVIHPSFAPAEIERQRKQALSALSVAHDDPAYIADAAFDRLTFDGTAYGHPPDGTEEAVRRLTSSNIREFYARNYRPDNSILALVGDIRADEAYQLAARFFAEWKQDDPPPTRQPSTIDSSRTGTAHHSKGRRIVVIDKPDSVQTEIRVGNRGIPRGSSDYLALTVANQILGGPATNRLYKALRTEHGLTYSASSELDCYQTNGSWEGKTSTRSAETIKSLRLVLDQMNRLRDHAISQGELQTAQSYLTGHMALEVESPDNIVTQTLNLMVYNLPLDYWNLFPRELRTLQTEEVLNATRRYMDPERNVIVLVGNASAFSRELKKLGEVRVIPIERLDLGSPDLERPVAVNP